MKETEMHPVHAANPVTNSGNTAFGVEGINSILPQYFTTKGNMVSSNCSTDCASIEMGLFT